MTDYIRFARNGKEFIEEFRAATRHADGTVYIYGPDDCEWALDPGPDADRAWGWAATIAERDE